MTKKSNKPDVDPRFAKAVKLAQIKEDIDTALELLTRPVGEGRGVEYPFEFVDELTEGVFRLLREIGEDSK